MPFFAQYYATFDSDDTGANHLFVAPADPACNGVQERHRELKAESRKVTPSRLRRSSTVMRRKLRMLALAVNETWHRVSSEVERVGHEVGENLRKEQARQLTEVEKAQREFRDTTEKVVEVVEQVGHEMEKQIQTEQARQEAEVGKVMQAQWEAQEKVWEFNQEQVQKMAAFSQATLSGQLPPAPPSFKSELELHSLGSTKMPSAFASGLPFKFLPGPF